MTIDSEAVTTEDLRKIAERRGVGFAVGSALRVAANYIEARDERIAELERELALLRKAALDPDPAVWAQIRASALAEQAKEQEDDTGC